MFSVDKLKNGPPSGAIGPHISVVSPVTFSFLHAPPGEDARSKKVDGKAIEGFYNFQLRSVCYLGVYKEHTTGTTSNNDEGVRTSSMRWIDDNWLTNLYFFKPYQDLVGGTSRNRSFVKLSY